MKTYKCKSGMHAWFFKEDAEKCCNGYRRVQVWGREGMLESNWNGLCGYKWEPIPPSSEYHELCGNHCPEYHTCTAKSYEECEFT